MLQGCRKTKRNSLKRSLKSSFLCSTDLDCLPLNKWQLEQLDCCRLTFGFANHQSLRTAREQQNQKQQNLSSSFLLTKALDPCEARPLTDVILSLPELWTLPFASEKCTRIASFFCKALDAGSAKTRRPVNRGWWNVSYHLWFYKVWKIEKKG